MTFEKRETRNHLPSAFFGTTDGAKFMAGLQQAVVNINPQNGIYAGDNLFTYHRNLGFLEDDAFMKSFQSQAKSDIEKSILWRISIVLWGARNGMKLEGDFVECACYKGTTARIICDTLDFGNQKDKKYYLYDLFEHDESMPHHQLPEHSKKLYNEVSDRFSHLENVVITQGKVPESLKTASPEKIAFMHLDLNNAEAEIGALDVLFERMTPGAVLVLDDYGWLGYRAQKLAEDPWFSARGYHVAELPTGQGMVIKQKD
jgi:hypothetical protein